MKMTLSIALGAIGMKRKIGVIMSQQTKRPLSHALPVAQEIVAKLSPYCIKIEVAGSIRREREMIGDIEIVALPRVEPLHDLFGKVYNTVNLLHEFLIENKVQLLKGAKPHALQKQFMYAGYQVDLFLPASPDHWGSIFTIRTGSHAFNMWLMTAGQARAGVSFEGGRVYRGKQVLDTSTEEKLFDALDMLYVPLDKRDNHQWKAYQGVRENGVLMPQGCGVSERLKVPA